MDRSSPGDSWATTPEPPPVGEAQPDIPEALVEGLDAYRAGDLEHAKALYLQVLLDTPDNPEAMHLLSAVDGHQGRAADGVELCRRAIAINPGRAAFHNTLGQLLEKLGRDDESEAAYREALRLQPELAAAENNLGALFFKCGDTDQAMTHFGRSVELDPEIPETFNNLGRALNNLGQYGEASAMLSRAIRLRPGYAQAHNNLGHVLRALDRLDEAAECFSRAIELAPGFAIAHFNLGTIWQERGRPQHAADCFEKSISLNRSFAPAFNRLGAAYQNLGYLGRALAAYRTATVLDPENPDPKNNRAAMHLLRGELDEAMEVFGEILEQDPGSIPALSGIAALMERFGPREDGLALVRPVVESGNAPIPVVITYLHLLKRTGEVDKAMALASETLAGELSAVERADLQFVLGDLLEELGDYEEAFRNYRAANDRKAPAYDPGVLTQYVNDLVDFFDRDRLDRLPSSGNDSEAPIFVVGMPRTGTSFVRGLLLNHPGVFAAGDLDDLSRIAREMHSILDSRSVFPWCLRFISPGELDRLADIYLEHLDKQRTAHEQPILRAVDSMPMNFLYLALIEMMFPKARIIHCVRDPVDTALSCYVNNFPDDRLNFSYKLENIGQFQLEYERLMSHWRSVIRLPMFEVRYEDLLADPGRSTGRMLEFLGLDGECSPERADAAQQHAMRRTNYTVRRSWRYARELEPLRRLLATGRARPQANT